MLSLSPSSWTSCGIQLWLCSLGATACQAQGKSLSTVASPKFTYLNWPYLILPISLYIPLTLFNLPVSCKDTNTSYLCILYKRYAELASSYKSTCIRSLDFTVEGKNCLPKLCSDPHVHCGTYICTLIYNRIKTFKIYIYLILCLYKKSIKSCILNFVTLTTWQWKWKERKGEIWAIYSTPFEYLKTIGLHYCNRKVKVDQEH